MDILKMLQESGNDLYPDDLDYLEAELDTHGRYSQSYKMKCRILIDELRAWKSEDASQSSNNKVRSSPKKKRSTSNATDNIYVRLTDLVPETCETAQKFSPVVTLAEEVYHDISEIRHGNNYNSRFKKYIAGKKDIDSEFVDVHYSMFEPWELNAIISVRQMTEEFLEKYFEALDHDKIARYQKFSESFFMKHFNQLDPDIVLRYGKNKWRKKENRSDKLDVFLRLKGVRI